VAAPAEEQARGGERRAQGCDRRRPRKGTEKMKGVLFFLRGAIRQQFGRAAHAWCVPLVRSKKFSRTYPINFILQPTPNSPFGTSYWTNRASYEHATLQRPRSWGCSGDVARLLCRCLGWQRRPRQRPRQQQLQGVLFCAGLLHYLP